MQSRCWLLILPNISLQLCTNLKIIKSPKRWRFVHDKRAFPSRCTLQSALRLNITRFSGESDVKIIRYDDAAYISTNLLNAVKRNLFAICRESGRGNCQILELPKISSRLEEGGLRPGKWAIVAAVVLSGQLSVVLGFMWPVMRPCISFSPILRRGWQLVN